MVLPALMLPIILATAAVGGGIAQGISSVKNVKSEAEALQETSQAQIKERQREAKKLMQQQKTSFLKSGVYFNSGSPLDVINETYDYSLKDINALIKNTNAQAKNLERQGKTAFFGSIMEGLGNGAMSFFNTKALGSGSKIVLKTSSQKNTFKDLWEKSTGKYKGGFGLLPANNRYSSGNIKTV